MDTQLCFPKKQDKVKKRVIWDIEVAEELQWKGWVLGKVKLCYYYKAEQASLLETVSTVRL